MWDRKLKKQLKGKVLEACVVPSCIYGLGTLALTERQEEKMQIAENNWVRRICKVTQEDRRKMKELREEIGMKKHPKLRWKDCVKRDLERAGTNGQEWKTTAEDREMENINNESGRSNQVTWTPPCKGIRGRRRNTA